MKTDLNYVKKLIKMLDESGLSALELEEEGLKIKLSKPKEKYVSAGTLKSMPVTVEADDTSADNAHGGSSKDDNEIPENAMEIRSPMVGTFYRAPSPDADSYVQIGTVIKPGAVICIIEAMKLMNEIEAEFEGKIVKILVDNGQAVEYDQPLFLVEKL